MGQLEVISILKQSNKELTAKQIQNKLKCANGTMSKLLYRLRMRQQVNFRKKKYGKRMFQFVYSL